MNKLDIALLAVAVTNTKSKVFGRIHLDRIVKKGQQFKTDVRLNETVFMPDVIVTKAELEAITEAGQSIGLIRLRKDTVLSFLDTLPEGTEVGANVTANGHVYIKGLDTPDLVRLGEMPAPAKKPKIPSDDGFGGAPAMQA